MIFAQLLFAEISNTYYFKQKQKMGIYTISYSRLFKILEWVLVIFLILFSGFFMTDVWEKYTSKDSSFKPYSEPRSMLPTIVVCFKPYAKQSSLNEYNITQQQLFYSEFPEEIENIWDQFVVNFLRKN